jgi:hypothetical protein
LYHGWTYTQTPSSVAKATRAPRVQLPWHVQLFFPFENWQIAWSLQTSNLSSSGILAQYFVTDAETAEYGKNLETICNVESRVQIHIDHPYDTLGPLQLSGDIVRIEKGPKGLLIAAEFSKNVDSSRLAQILESALGPRP